jgi:hypothetical protein
MHEIIERPLRDASDVSGSSRRAGESATSMAWAGVLLGAVGLFIFNLVFGPLAIGLGVTALRRGARPGAWRAGLPRAGRAMAWASVVLGAADVAVLLALAAFSLGHGALTWHLAL